MEVVFLIDNFINNMINILKLLQGKKSYLVAFCVGLVAVIQYLKYITPEIAVVLYGLLGASGVATLRAGIEKVK